MRKKTIYLEDPDLWENLKDYAKMKQIPLGVLIEKSLKGILDREDSLHTHKNYKYYLEFLEYHVPLGFKGPQNHLFEILHNHGESMSYKRYRNLLKELVYCGSYRNITMPNGMMFIERVK